MTLRADVSSNVNSIDKRVNVPDKEEILRALCDADALRDANELMRQCVLLLTYGYCSSLAAVEEQMRHLALNARLIAVPFDAAQMPSGIVCTNPFRIDGSTSGARLTERNCAFQVSLSVEGERSAQTECRQYGADTADTNLNRLRGDCGFLVLQSNSNVQNTWRESLAQFAGDVQRADERATLVTGVAACATCGRFETRATELRALACCHDTVVCSEQCWASHVEQEHSEVAIFGSDSASHAAENPDNSQK